MHPEILLLLRSITTDWVWLLIFTRFLDHTWRCTTVGRTPLNKWSVRRRDLYLTTITTDKHPCPLTYWGFLFTLKNPTVLAGFEPTNLGTKGQHATSRPPKPLSSLHGHIFYSLYQWWHIRPTNLHEQNNACCLKKDKIISINLCTLRFTTVIDICYDGRL